MIALRCHRFDPLPADAVCVSIGSQPVTRDWPDWCESSARLALPHADPVSFTPDELARMSAAAPKGKSKVRHYTDGRTGNKGQQRRKRSKKRCAWCRRAFTPRNPSQRYCSTACHHNWERSPAGRAKESARNRANYLKRLGQLPENQRPARQGQHEAGLQSAKRRAA